MTMPAGVTLVTVSGTLLNADGTPAVGWLAFTPSVPVAHVGATTAIVPGLVTVPITSGGVFTVNLPATDDTGGNPTGWTYTVVEHVTNGRTFSMQLLAANGSAQRYEALVPVPTSLGTAVVVGPRGPTGAPGALSPRFGSVGDSIVGHDGGFLLYAELLSGGRIQAIQTNSMPGQNTSYVLANIATTTQANPKVDTCLIFGGTNDGYDLPTFSSDTAATVAALRAAGIAPVCCTAPPQAANAAKIGTFNAWLSEWCPANGVPLVDMTSALTDSSTGQWAAALTDDGGTHPTIAGLKVMGQAIVDGLGPLLSPPRLTTMLTTGAPNLIADSTFATGTDRPVGADVAPAGYTSSLVADARGFKWWRQTASSAAGMCGPGFGQTFSSGAATFSPGDTLRFSYLSRQGQDAVMEVIGGQAAGINVQFLLFDSSWASIDYFNVVSVGHDAYGPATAHDGVITREFVVPARVANILMSVRVGRTDGTYDVALPTLINLTALGV